ncbi:MAG: hypothetical protein QM564_02615 [Bergeyella sp.]
MESVIVYPKSKKQKSLLKSFLEEMKIRFEVTEKEDDTLMTEEEFYAKIDRAIKDAEEGKVVEYTPEMRKKLFGDIL